MSVTAAGRQAAIQVTARRRALIAEVLARLPPDTQRAAAEAFFMFAQAAREPSGNPGGLPYHHPPRMTQRSRPRADAWRRAPGLTHRPGEPAAPSDGVPGTPWQVNGHGKQGEGTPILRSTPGQAAPEQPTMILRPAVSPVTHVVVGVDGSAGSEAALRWAAAEAVRRQTGLRIVSAWQEPARTGRPPRPGSRSYPAGSTGPRPFPAALPAPHRMRRAARNPRKGSPDPGTRQRAAGTGRDRSRPGPGAGRDRHVLPPARQRPAGNRAGRRPKNRGLACEPEGGRPAGVGGRGRRRPPGGDRRCRVWRGGQLNGDLRKAREHSLQPARVVGPHRDGRAGRAPRARRPTSPTDDPRQALPAAPTPAAPGMPGTARQPTPAVLSRTTGDRAPASLVPPGVRAIRRGPPRGRP